MYYNLGDVVLVEDYDMVSSAWIAPDGNIIYVTACDHDDLVERFGFGSVDECENAGYIHLTYNTFVNWDEPRPTKAQVDTILLWCAANDETIPYWAIVEQVHTTVPMSNMYLSTLNRKQRDMFYPNSGD